LAPRPGRGLRVALIDARCLRQNRAGLAALEVGKGKPPGA